jgi:hypothetical protein
VTHDSAVVMYVSLASMFTWVHRLVPAEASGVLGLVLDCATTYSFLPFDMGALVAPSDSEAGAIADVEVIFPAGTPLPCNVTLDFYPSIAGQTLHKTALYVGYGDTPAGRCARSGCSTSGEGSGVR